MRYLSLFCLYTSIHLLGPASMIAAIKLNQLDGQKKFIHPVADLTQVRMEEQVMNSLKGAN
jgi:hypothetical protein